MYNISVVVNENTPEQLEIFLKTFREVNKSNLINYTFIITSTGFIRHYEGCQHRITVPYKNDCRLGFLYQLDQILAEKPDLVVVAHDKIFCRKSMADWFIKLIEYTDEEWELCGSAVMPPAFPLGLCQSVEFAPVIPQEYATLDCSFYIINPKNVESNNAEIAAQIVANSQYDLIDELVFNIRYDKKIVNQLICCNSVTYVNELDNVKNVNMPFYYEPLPNNSYWYFLDEYYKLASPVLQHDLRSFFKTVTSKEMIQHRSRGLLIAQNITVSQMVQEEINVTKI